MGLAAPPPWYETILREFINDLFGPPRRVNDPVTNRHMDIAAALQRSFEDAMLRRFAHLRTTYGIEQICLAGVGAQRSDDR